MCAWICLFLQERRAIEVDGFELPVMSEALHAAVEHTDTLGELFEQVRKAACAYTCTCTMHMHNARAHVRHVGCMCSVYRSIVCYVPEQEFDRTLSRMMLEWCLHKDIRRIAQCLDPHMLGVFVKTVLRLP